MVTLKKANTNNQILNRLVLENCLSFGRSPKFNNKKITHYISGTRQKMDIFKFYEMRYLLLKVYPLIHNLFLQKRLNTKKKQQLFLNQAAHFKKASKKLPPRLQEWKRFWLFHSRINQSLRGNLSPFVPKILFASTNELYSDIISSAARRCHMPFHINRWLSGTVTAASAYLDDLEQWSFLTNDSQKNFHINIQEKFGQRKNYFFQQVKKIRQYQISRKPSLIIIPDVSNNEMIVKETNTLGIPVLGLINSNCQTEIAYPIFANDLSIYSIHFFCNFLSALITKELVKHERKIYIVKKKRRNLQFSQVKRYIFRCHPKSHFFRIQSLKKKLKTLKKFKKIKLKENELQFLQERKISLLKKIHFLSKKRFLMKEEDKPYVFPGRYFLDNFVIPRVREKKERYKELNPEFWKKSKTLKISPKLLTFMEKQKSWKKTGRSVFSRKRIFSKMQWVKRLHRLNFPKVRRAIRLPAHKPQWKHWTQTKFYFSKSLRFTKNTSWAFQVGKFTLRKRRLRNWRESKKQNPLRKQIRSLMRRFFGKKKPQKTKFRKKWSVKTPKNQKIFSSNYAFTKKNK